MQKLMTKYKVGDVAALFSKPKSPTTTGGKKLQSLFEDYYGKKSKPSFYSQVEENNANKSEKIADQNDHGASKKSKKRKFSSTVDSEVDENVSSKKFKESVEEKGFENYQNKKQKFKKQKDFPRKNKQSKGNSFNFNPTFPKFEPENVSKTDAESSSPTKFSNSPKNSKQIKSFIKKSKKNSLGNNSSIIAYEDGNDSGDEGASSPTKFSNSPKNNKQSKSFIKKSKKKSLENSNSKMANEDCNDSGDEDALRDEIKEFMQTNSVNSVLEEGKDSSKKGKKLSKKEQSNIEKTKKDFLIYESIFQQKQDTSLEQNVKSKKKNKKNVSQDFFMNSKESETNSFNLGDVKPKIKYDVEQSSPSKGLNSVVQDNVMKSKKFKRELPNTNEISTSDNTTDMNASKAKRMDFVRKPKNKKKNNTFEQANSNNLNNMASDNLFGDSEDLSSSVPQKKIVNKFEVTAPDFIKLSNSSEDNKVDPQERLSRTLFVGNLPSNISKTELKNYFGRFGVVESVRLPGIETDKAKVFGKNPPKLLHPNYASDSIPAFVTFREKKSAQEALNLSGCIFKGHHITVDFAVQPGTHKLYDDKRSIFVGNLPFDVKDESIWDTFSHCGRIEGVRVVRDRRTGLGKGFGYVLFSTVEAKNNALALGGIKIEGRDIRIKPVDSNKKAQKLDPTPNRRDTFKSHAIRMKKNSKATSGHKSVRKLTNKQKFLHKKKKTAEILQKAMK